MRQLSAWGMFGVFSMSPIHGIFINKAPRRGTPALPPFVFFIPAISTLQPRSITEPEFACPQLTLVDFALFSSPKIDAKRRVRQMRVVVLRDRLCLFVVVILVAEVPVDSVA